MHRLSSVFKNIYKSGISKLDGMVKDTSTSLPYVLLGAKLKGLNLQQTVFDLLGLVLWTDDELMLNVL